MKNLKSIFALSVILLAIAASFATSNPFAGILVLGIGSFGLATKRTNVLGLNTQFFDPSQLQQVAILTDAINKHFGTEPVPNFGGSEMVSRAATIQNRIYLDTATKELHLNIDNTRKNNGWTNVDTNLAPSTALFVAYGVILKSSAGLVGAALETLDFEPIANIALNNGYFSLSLNGKKVVEDLAIETNFNLIPEYKGFHRFSDVKILRPNGKWEASIRANVAPACHLEFSLVGTWVEVAAASK